MNDLPNHAHCRCMWSVRECSNNHPFNCRICGDFKEITPPTPPTQEKEPNFVRVSADAFSKLKYEINVKVEPEEYCRYCHKTPCEEEKPTQDTESWEDLRKSIVGLGICCNGDYCEEGHSKQVSEEVIEIIKQKKQVWNAEAHLAGLERLRKVREEARTQGAEAAVEKIRSEQDEFAIGVYGQGTEFSQYSFDEACKEARKV